MDFFSSLDIFLLDGYPTFLAGDFICVVDPERDVRGPGQGRPYRGAVALHDLIAQFCLRDAWVEMHGDQFAVTWSRGCSASRLVKIILPAKLNSLLLSCDALFFPDESLRISDHASLYGKLRLRARAPSHDMWRMDPCLLTDAVSAAEIRASLGEQSKNQARQRDWDSLKAGWRVLLTKAGRERKARITRELNEH